MRLKWTASVRALFAMSPLMLMLSCNDSLVDAPTHAHEVGFHAGGVSTRTEMLPDGLSAAWKQGDEIAMWAKASSGSYILSNQLFKVYGADQGRGVFTSTLASPMPDGEYTYFCCYPQPKSVSGMTAYFDIPSKQDGKVSSGADIMVGTPEIHGPLASIPELEDRSGLRMNMNRMLHQFRFYVPEYDSVLEGETIEKIVVTFPREIAGTVAFNIEEPHQSGVLSSGKNTITLNLSENLGISSLEQTAYACMSILPTTFASGECMTVRAYTATHIANSDPINLRARTFEAGHSTPVALKLINKDEYCRVRFTVSGNNLGENANSITLTAPEGCIWGETGTDKYVYSPGYGITTGETFDIVFEDVNSYRAFSRKSMSVTFDTEHVTATQSINLPDMSRGHMTEVSAALPYLLYEDFSSLSSFSSHDNYGTSSTGDFGAYSFLNGWSGGRVGGEAGKCIRIACRRETSANYHARVDSAPIIALKKAANLSVTFDYGMNNQYSDGLITNPDVGQTFYLGYVTSTKAYGSGADDGTFESQNSYYFNEKTGSYDSTPNTDTYVLNNVPTGVVRITWRTKIESNAGLTNTTCWLYIDNVKVQIAK